VRGLFNRFAVFQKIGNAQYTKCTEPLNVAIIFARLDPVHLTPRSGAARLIAYTGRTIIADRGLLHDYRHLAGDLAHQEVMLPADYPAEFDVPAILATALDRAELQKVRTRLEDRDRLPQVGLNLTIALPPDDEVYLHEAAEIMRRIVNAARGSRPIAAHFAIHDHRRNRHGHGLFALRGFDENGVAGPRERDLVVRIRSTKAGMQVVEGIDWPSLAWEIQQLFFVELGTDLVVDPVAPVPGRHLSPVVYGLGSKSGPDTKRDEDYGQTRSANIAAIEGSPTALIETLLRGRSTLQVAQIERLCAKFLDSRASQQIQIDRILSDQNVITLADTSSADGPSYVTTRRVHRLVARAVKLIENSGIDRVTAVTGSDHAAVVEQILELCAVGCHAPLILGQSLSDCDATNTALAAYQPIVSTIEMAITGLPDLREKGRNRGVRLQHGRLVVVPQAERIDDFRLARLIVAVNRFGGDLILGHDQSLGTGVVCRHLAAYAADRVPEIEPAASDPVTIERLLRSGLVGRAVTAMSVCGRLEFGIPQDRDAGTTMFIACDDPRRIAAISDSIRKDRISAGMIGRPTRLEASRGPLELSVEEWVIATGRVQGEPGLEVGQFAQISAIDEVRNIIVLEHNHVLTRIDLGSKIAIRPATAISIREARGLPANVSLVVELTDPRRLWGALLLAAQRGELARVQISPTIARTRDDLIDAARRYLPAAFPHRRHVLGDRDAELDKMVPKEATKLPDLDFLPDQATVRVTTPPSVNAAENVAYIFDDPDAELGKMVPKAACKLPDLDFLPDQATVRITTPPSINAAENVRNLISSNVHARLGYHLLFNHVGRHNPNSAANAEHVLALCSSELSRIVARHLAGIQHREAPDDDLSVFDLPPELTEMEPRNFDLIDVEWLKLDLWTMTIPGSVWGTRAAFKFRARPLSEPLDDAAKNSI
jgi:hypothetical protein